MIFNASKTHSLCNEYYNMTKEYSIYNDPNFTYQELVLMCNVYHWQAFPNGIDSDNFYSCEDEWIYCIAHLTQPMICDKKWNEVLVDRAHTSPPNLKYDDKGFPIFWYQTPEYKDIFEKEMKEIEEKQLEEYRAWEIKKAKQRDYQRMRRARIKEMKENGNK